MNCEKIFQWDVNAYVSVPDGIKYVDYDTDPVTRVEVSEGKARIPDEILETSGLKLMWFCVDDHTRYLYNLEVRPRPVPPDHATTPTETVTFATLVEKVDTAVSASENVNISSERTSDGVKVTTTNRNGEETVVEVKDGKDGKNGKDGAQGPKGDSIVGPQGPQGERGPAGESIVGPKGDQGPKGDPGESIVGPEGPQGPKGDPGEVTYIENPYDDTQLKERVKTVEDKVEEIELFKFPNATIVGEPLIESGNVSRFSNANYLIFPFVVDVRGRSFEIDMCFTTGSDVTVQQNVLDSNFGLALAIQNGRGLMAMSSNGTSWDIGVSTGSIVIERNKTYYAKVSWDGTTYKTALSADGVNYVEDMTIASTLGLYPTTMYIGGSPDLFGAGSAHPFGGTINLNRCHLTIAGLEVWAGMDDAGMSTRANVSLSNLDAEGEKRFSQLKENIVELGQELSNTNSELLKKADKSEVERNAQKIIEEHYRATPDFGIYTVRFPKWETSHTSAGEKLDDNQGLILTPATNTVKEVNTYPHCFDTIDVNAYVDNDGVRHITAIKGDPSFRDTGRVDVFVCMRTYWEKYWEEDGYEYYSRCYYPKEGYTINRLAINRDGSYNPWMLIAKYMAGDILDDDSAHTHELYSSKGLRPAHYISTVEGDEEINDSISWSGMQPIFKRRGNFYTGSLASEIKHFATSTWLYFATKNSQSVMYGYANSSFQYIAAETSENQPYFVVTASQSNAIDLLQCVSVGDHGTTTAPDRNYGYTHNIVYDARVIGKQTLESGNVAIILDHAPFSVTQTSWISSFHEVSGYSDYILGRNGSPVSNTNGRHGMVLDGIEIMVGGYETVGNMFFNATPDPLVRDVVVCNDASKFSTNANAFITNGVTSPIKATVTTNEAWNYVTEVGLDLDNGISINSRCGDSGSGSTTGHADGQYFDAITSGQREVLSFGNLGNGGYAGLRYVAGSGGLSYAAWYILARLSLNAVGGELSA